MSRTLCSAAIAAAVLLFLTGCPKKQPVPNPADTVFQPGTNSSDWLNPQDIYGADAEDLSYRSDSFADGTRLENLLPDVYFQFNTAFLPETERAKVRQAAEHLRQNPNDRLLIEGNCDWRGTLEYNLALGDRRAGAVKQYLIDQGIDASRVETVSFGDQNAVENASETQMAQDRRADLVVIR